MKENLLIRLFVAWLVVFIVTTILSFGLKVLEMCRVANVVWYEDVSLAESDRRQAISYQRFPIPRNEDGTTYDIGFRDDGIVVWRKLE